MILVVGATGYLGGKITRRLLDQNQAVRMLVRPDADYIDLEDAGCEPSIGDIKYPESFGPAFNGVKTVITTASASDPTDYDTYDNIDLEGNRNLIDAAKAAGVQQFIFVSALGADISHINPYFRAKGQTEAYLRVSGLPYTILASTLFLEPWLKRFVEEPLRTGQPVIMVGEGNHRHSFIAAADAAAFATAVIDHPAAINKTVAIGGPKAFSWADVITRTEDILGQLLTVQHFTPGETLPGLSPDISQVAVNFEAYEYVLDMEQIAAQFGITLTPLVEVLRHRLGEFVP